jgi:hypothetical protein
MGIMYMQKTLVNFALVAAPGLIAVETVDFFIQMAEAKGCPVGNASGTRCVHP